MHALRKWTRRVRRGGGRSMAAAVGAAVVLTISVAGTASAATPETTQTGAQAVSYWNGVAVNVIVVDAGKANAEAFLRSAGGNWPEVVDPGARTSIAYGVRGAPETFFISRNGRVAAWHSGPISYQQLSNEITHLLGSNG